MPKYKSIPRQYVEKMEKIGHVNVYVSWRQQYCGILKLKQDGVTYYFVDNEYYFGETDIMVITMRRKDSPSLQRVNRDTSHY